ncbi:hypothetical protein PTSG_05584 [Salpingoeca rosetta]|uniref:Nuclear pore complex protein n=1 Tax=Salpingoeca rosetta (strain ATCC 50818 / BSB-021) TaxID=946362 RepID=F2UBM3_SALR5|nr:uncharacterized protein PTSG_05584 [Salpingoeca rosetta]EGD73889.1 hypothetical protein PTSG_05584 [Salpingoeca rosetta]|eukprot:XP_004993452.1 hypothetical protein PTSG_05584 [Salpingoeca rosetta]
MADDSEFSFQLPSMPSPVAQRPRYRTEHFAGDDTQTSINASTASAHVASTPAFMRSSTAGDRTLSDISAIQADTTFASPRQWYARPSTAASQATPRPHERSRLEDRVQHAVSQLSLITDGTDLDATIHVDSPFETKRPKTSAIGAMDDRSRLTVSRYGDLTTLDEPTIAGRHESVEEQFMHGFLSSQAGSNGLGPLPILASRHHQHQQQHQRQFQQQQQRYQQGLQRPGSIPSLCVHFADIFKQSLAELSDDMTLAGKPKFEELINSIKRQKESRATWLLLNDVMQLHASKDSRPSPSTPTAALAKSEKEKVERYFPLKDFDLTVYRAVVSWLEQVAAEDFEDYIGEVLYETDDVAWRHTLAAILAADANTPDLVKALDPDAVSRTGGRLDATDASEEAVFLKRIFTLIRCGRLDMAIKLCQSCNQPWRAATLMAFQPTAAAKTAGALQTKQDVQRGNLLERACLSLIENRSTDKHERGVYASLMGKATPLLELSASWQDALWALLRTRVLERERSAAEELAAGGGGANDTGPQLGPEDVEAIVETLEDHSNDQIRNGARTIHASVQKAIILGRPWSCLTAINGQIDTFLRECRAAEETQHYIAPLDETKPRLNKSEEAAKVAPYLCHFAHLALVLRELGRTGLGEDADASAHETEIDDIIEAYVFDLIDKHMHSCVAVYTSQISDEERQIAIYSFYLAGITDGRLKSHCLEEARKAGLPMAEITRAVVGRVREHDKQAEEESPSAGTVSAADMAVINALEWLLQDPQQKLHALQETNAVLRGFLLKDKLAAARELLYKHVIPSNLAAFSDAALASDVVLRSAINEHVSLRAYVDADDAFEVWRHHTYEMRPTPPATPGQMSTGTSLRVLQSEQEQRVFKNKQDIWEHRRHKYTQTAVSKLMNVIRMDAWMLDEEGSADASEESSGARQAAMAALRRKCLPQSCLRIMDIFYDVEEADKPQLVSFLTKVRRASLRLLERGDDLLGVADA